MSGRDRRIDFLRGLCLVGMVSWHLCKNPAFPLWLSFPVIQACNFVAEGFVMLAGVGVAFAAAKRRLSIADCWRRAGLILLAQYALVAVLLALHKLDWIEMPEADEMPLGSLLLKSALLVYQPYLGDVLPLFVLLFAAAPAFLFVQRRTGNVALLVLSFAAVLAWQKWALGFTGRINAMGAFDFNSWQFVFCTGLVVGKRWPDWAAANDRTWRRALAVCLGVLVAAAIVRWYSMSDQLAWLPRSIDLRHPLTPFRMVYIFSYLAVLACATRLAWPRLAARRAIQLVALLGAHSLTVFAVSVVLDYLAQDVALARWPTLAVGLAVWAAELLLLVALAWWRDRGRTTPRGYVAHQN